MAETPTGTDHGAEHTFELSGGRLCLDFVNTVSGDRSAAVRERAPTYAALLAFFRQARAIEPSDARRLLAEARRRPEEAAEVHARALALREALYRIFTAAADGGVPPPGDLALLSDHLSRALSHRRLAPAEQGCCALAWTDPPDALDAPLWRVAASAADLLTSEAELRRVRVCGLHATHECSWVFMDHTRAGTRRWCSMKDCGNKAKARRHYERTRG